MDIYLLMPLVIAKSRRGREEGGGGGGGKGTTTPVIITARTCQWDAPFSVEMTALPPDAGSRSGLLG